MLTLTEAEWAALLAQYLLPLFRVLGLIAAAPILSNRAVPARVRLALGLAVTLAVAPNVNPAAAMSLGSWQVLPAIVSEFLVGAAMGLFLRLIFAAIDLAAAFVGFQMGLSFAVFFSPTSGAQTPVLNEFFGLFATLLFLLLDGHLMLILAVSQSLAWLPPLGYAGWDWHDAWALALTAPTVLFTAALMLSLPVTAALLLTNLALGMLTRTAPQLNIFAIGFPITITVGFVALLFTLPALGVEWRELYGRGFELAESWLMALGAMPR